MQDPTNDPLLENNARLQWRQRWPLLIVLLAATSFACLYFVMQRWPDAHTASDTFTAENIIATNTMKLSTSSTSSLAYFDSFHQFASFGGSSPAACSAGSLTSQPTLAANGTLANNCTTLTSTANSSGAGDATKFLSGAGTWVTPAGGFTSTATSPNLMIASSSTSAANFAGSTPAACSAGSLTSQPTIASTGAITNNCTTLTSAANSSGAGSTTKFLRGDGTWSTPTGGGGGLYNGTMTGTIPTQAGTGLTNNWNTTAGSTFTDGDQGIYWNWPSGSTTSESAVTMPAPATPYTVTATMEYVYPGGAANAGNWGIGWTAGTSGTTGNTNAQWFIYCPQCASGFQQRIFNASSATSVVSLVNQSAAFIRTSGQGLPWFMRIKDDGTTVTYSISFDGLTYTTVYSVAKASGFLGATGYSNVGFVVNDTATAGTLIAIVGWKVTSP